MRLQDNIDILTDPNTIFVACISYGKDSLAMLRAIKRLGLPLHRIIHTEVWATDTIPADLPPMVEFKAKADKIIKELYGIEVEHVCAIRSEERERETVSRENGSHTRECSTTSCKAENTLAHSKDFRKQSELGARKSSTKKLTYEDIFYRRFKNASGGWKRTNTVLRQSEIPIAEANSKIYGFPMRRGNWCTTYLKPSIRIPNLYQPRAMVPTAQALFGKAPRTRGGNKYRSIFGNCRRRAVADSKTHRQKRRYPSVSGNRVARGFVRFDLSIPRFAIADIHRFGKRRLLVLP